MSGTPTAVIGWRPVRYCIETDPMAVENPAQDGGR
jgi:hypothetical protein